MQTNAGFLRRPSRTRRWWRASWTPGWWSARSTVSSPPTCRRRCTGGGGRTPGRAASARGRLDGPVLGAERLADGRRAEAGRLPPADHRPGGAHPRGTHTVTDDRVAVTLDGVRHTFHRAADWLGRDGDAWHVRDHDPVAAPHRRRPRGRRLSLTAPMPGTVTVVEVAVGDEVAAGQSLLVVEAMKMEHVISAPHAGTVAGSWTWRRARRSPWTRYWRSSRRRRTRRRRHERR
ncbi:hypothetical protein LV779_03620 [Streptomyces thinghirensis]|nr:hypothetical protein [Streptomyces thinghirensis]